MEQTTEFTLRAMAKNYTPRHHLWDELDRDACKNAANEIKLLKRKLSDADDFIKELLERL